MKGMFRGVSLAAVCLAAAGPALGQEHRAVGGAIILADKAQAPIRISAPITRYPDELWRARVQGTVIVEARIDSTGRVEAGSLRIVESPDPRFDQAAKDYVAKSRYRPGRAGGKRVAMVVRVPVLFDLNAR